MSWRGVIEHYREFLPVSSRTPVVTLCEGNTPLIRADRLRETLGARCEIYLKYEGANPTGSFKDRGMTLAVSKALEEGSRAVICASTGNTSASAAAYAARAGCQAFVVVPEGGVTIGKLSQTIIHGACLIQIQAGFDQALEAVKGIAEKYPVSLVNSLNPYRLEGQKTGAFEICDALGESPDYLCIPVGNAGNITAYWRGFEIYRKAGRASRSPRMMGWQAEGAAPIVLNRVIENPETIASAIRIGNPASWQLASQALAESHGAIGAVTDAEILEAYRMVARLEGLYCEPASAASVAGLARLWREGVIPAGSRVVCILTGHGLKDPETAIDLAEPPQVVAPEIEAIVAAMGLP
ncbi:MAG: threonine synthase [Candidatus Methylomirabilales bacterium]